MTERTACSVARRLADVLEAKNIPYAIGGALALGYYTEPRGTMDVDINIFVTPPDAIEALIRTLGEVGFEVDRPDTVLRTATQDGQFRGRIDGLRVDVFVPAIDYYASLRERRRRVPFGDACVWVLGAEDLAVLKLMFLRPKDVADLHALVRDYGEQLDTAAVRRQVVALVGEDDVRVSEWDGIVAAKPRRDGERT